MEEMESGWSRLRVIEANELLDAMEEAEEVSRRKAEAEAEEKARRK